MIVTINTDASFNPIYKIGGYAYWMVYNGLRLKRGGLLKSCENNIEAEVKAIANALYRLSKTDFKQVFSIIINTDCENAIHLITGETKTKNKSINDTIAAIRDYILKLKLIHNIGKPDFEYVEFRHVKAHTKATDKRSYVNDWCDKVAKDFIKLEILKRCPKKNSLPARGSSPNTG
jgi:ribonuclease HI